MMMETGGEVSKVDREKLVTCMTCPLCNKLFKDATTISECLHTFCRKCIYEKITEEELDSCPVCKIDLGCAPLEKLRADNNWQDTRTKVFPLKGQKSKEPEGTSLVPSPVRRKERSLSSQEHVSKLENLPKNLSSPETYSKVAQNRRQDFSVGESSKQHVLDRSTESIAEALEEKADLWKPLNRLVEAASKTKPNKVNSQGNTVKPAPHAHDNEVNLPDIVKECGNGYGSNVPSKENGSMPEPATSVRPRSRVIRQKREAVSERLNIPAQTVVDSRNKYNGRFNPIWFSLVASEDQEGDAPLPQISSCYLRVKDGDLPVSSIKKYLVRKLGLSSEIEVEISLRGQPVLSTLQLHNLVDWWVQTTPASEKIQTFVGSSAKDFVMVLSYSRKARPP
ncbi:hypothetical protein CRYUN_Cryun10bG0037800 [Craigia yunnanensis]